MTSSRDEAQDQFFEGEDYLKGGLLKEALAAFNRSLALRPDYGETWALQAVTLCILRGSEQARASAERAAKLDSDFGWAAAVVRGRASLEVKEFEDAFNAFNAVREHYWGLSTDLRQWWAEALMGIGRPAEAVDRLNRELEANSEATDMRRWRGQALLDLGRAEEALTDLNDVVAEHPRDAEAWRLRGEALAGLGLGEPAQDSYARYSTLSTGQADGASDQDSSDADEQTEISAPDLTAESAVPNAETKAQFERPNIDLADLAASDDVAGTESEALTEGDDQVREKAVLDILPRAVSDMPSETDSLGFTPLVDGLYALLNAEETRLPMAIAITAPWGSGKSSVMLQLEDRLRESPGPGSDGYSRRWYTVRLDAWKYEKSERLWAALAKSIYDRPQKEMGVRERLWFRLSLEWRRGAPSLLAKTVGFPALSAGVAAGLALVAGMAWRWITSADAPLDHAATIAASTGGAGLFAGAVGAMTRSWGIASHPFKRSIQGHVSRPRYEEQLGFTEEADRDVSNLVELLTHQDKRALAVFVDDLDRCGSRHIVEVIEAVNQIFNASTDRKCVFILGMDRQAVAANITAAYKETLEFLDGADSSKSDYGSRFLSKIVQMSVAIPTPGPEAMRDLLAQITGSGPLPEDQGRVAPPEIVDRVAEVLRDRSPANPADVRRHRNELERDVAGLTVERILSTDSAKPTQVAEVLAGIPPSTRGAVTDRAEQIVRGERFTADSEDVRGAEFEALEFLERNPRQLKRFDNAFRLQLHVANGSPSAALDFRRDQLVALAKWVAIRLRWPRLADDLDGDDGLLGALENGANGVEPDGTEMSVAYRRWASDADIRSILADENPDRRLASLPLDTFLRVA